MRLRLGSFAGGQLGLGGTRIPEAYEAYLRGLYAADRWELAQPPWGTGVSDGRTAQAERALDAYSGQGEERRRYYHHFTFYRAMIAAVLGRSDEAVRWLRKTAELGYPNVTAFRDEPRLASLHGHPGYEALLAELETGALGRREPLTVRARGRDPARASRARGARTPAGTRAGPRFAPSGCRGGT